MQRRALLALMAATPAALWAGDGPVLLGAAWRGPSADDPQHLGALAVDLAARQVSVRWSLPLPSRAHGLLAEPDGSLLAAAMRPGSWLLRCDREGHVTARCELETEAGEQRLAGHAVASADGLWLYTTQTDAEGRGWVAVRDRGSLRKVAQWPTHGVDPHHLLLHPASGELLVANGGIRRDAQGRKRDGERIDSSLVQLDPRDGSLRGQWRLPDTRLSQRHLAWAQREGEPLLGIALQAEHDHPADRAAAPVLALWDGRALTIPPARADAAGYAGDICATGSGFALSAQRSRRGLLWRADEPAEMPSFAEVNELCALATSADGDVWLAAAAGVGRWHPKQGAAMLRWPEPMALDNHWVVLPPA